MGKGIKDRVTPAILQRIMRIGYKIDLKNLKNGIEESMVISISDK